MPSHLTPIDLPELQVVEDESITISCTSALAPLQRSLHPISLCVLTSTGKLLEATTLDVQHPDDHRRLLSLIQDAVGDGLCVSLWSPQDHPPQHHLVEIVRNFLSYCTIYRDRLPASPVMASLMTAARQALCDQRDITELLTFVEPVLDQRDQDVDD